MFKGVNMHVLVQRQEKALIIQLAVGIQHSRAAGLASSVWLRVSSTCSQGMHFIRQHHAHTCALLLRKQEAH